MEEIMSLRYRTILAALAPATLLATTASAAPQLVIDNFGYDAGGWRVEQHPRMLGDVNGDGRDDVVGFGNAGVYVSLSNGDGTFQPIQLAVNNYGYDAGGWRVERHPRMLGDVNGDGRADIVGFGYAGAYVSLGNVNGTFQAPQLVVANYGYDDAAGRWRVEQHPRMLADVNGDGRDDIVGFGNAGVYVSRSNANGTFRGPQLVVANYGYLAGGWRVEWHPRMMADVNGDGRADIVGFGNAGTYVSRSNANGTFQAPQLVVANYGYSDGAGGWRIERHPRVMADVNGNGRADIVGFGNAGVYTSRSNANGTFQAPFFAVANYGYSAGGWQVDRHPRMLGRLNADARDDIVGFGNAGVYVSRSNANGTFQAPQLVVANFGYDAGGWRVERHPRMIGDITGDGRDDIVGFGNAGVWVSINNGNGTFQ